MDKLILLVGASGSGKTSVAKEMEKRGYNIIHSYTTREERVPNEWGHIFVNKFEYMNTPITDMIAFQEVYEGDYYWATKEQYKGKESSIYVVCPDGAEDVRRNLKFEDVKVITIYLQVDEGERWSRMIPHRDEDLVLDRLVADEEKFNIVKCDYTLNGNLELNEVVDNMEKVLTVGIII